ncbi:ferrous iron transport protein B [mine drainage metagenome]|uniref:Ferrous iron transport protein B n=1 Tax=mine drainage metagenome TaxID=410659 RepID=A0A1J5R6W5_9ZZZZ
MPENAAALGGALLDPLDLRALGAPRDAAAASGASASTLAALAAGFTPLSAFAYLVFVLLYVPCASTMGALRREVGWRWMAFSVAYGVGLAWCSATVVYQLGSFGAHPRASTAWIALCMAAFVALAWVLRRHGRRITAAAGTRLGDAAPSSPGSSCSHCSGCGGCASAAPRPRPQRAASRCSSRSASAPLLLNQCAS